MKIETIYLVVELEENDEYETIHLMETDLKKAKEFLNNHPEKLLYIVPLSTGIGSESTNYQFFSNNYRARLDDFESNAEEFRIRGRY